MSENKIYSKTPDITEIKKKPSLSGTPSTQKRRIVGQSLQTPQKNRKAINDSSAISSSLNTSSVSRKKLPIDFNLKQIFKLLDEMVIYQSKEFNGDIQFIENRSQQLHQMKSYIKKQMKQSTEKDQLILLMRILQRIDDRISNLIIIKRKFFPLYKLDSNSQQDLAFLNPKQEKSLQKISRNFSVQIEEAIEENRRNLILQRMELISLNFPDSRYQLPSLQQSQILDFEEQEKKLRAERIEKKKKKKKEMLDSLLQDIEIQEEVVQPVVEEQKINIFQFVKPASYTDQQMFQRYVKKLNYDEQVKSLQFIGRVESSQKMDQILHPFAYIQDQSIEETPYITEIEPSQPPFTPQIIQNYSQKN